MEQLSKVVNMQLVVVREANGAPYSRLQINLLWPSVVIE